MTTGIIDWPCFTPAFVMVFLQHVSFKASTFWEEKETWCSLLKGRQCPDPACHKLVKRNCDFSHSQGLKVKKIHCNFSHSLDTEVREALSIDHLHLHPWSCHRVHHNPLQQNWFRIETVHLCYVTLRSRYSEFWIAMQQWQLVERRDKQIESVVEPLTMWTAVPMKMQ